MAIPDLQVTAIRSEGVDARTVVTVEFEWLDGVHHGDGQLPDAVATAALAMNSNEWRSYWQRPHFVERELYDRGPMRMVTNCFTECLGFLLTLGVLIARGPQGNKLASPSVYYR